MKKKKMSADANYLNLLQLPNTSVFSTFFSHDVTDWMTTMTSEIEDDDASLTFIEYILLGLCDFFDIRDYRSQSHKTFFE